LGKKNKMKQFFTKHPVLSVIALAVIWPAFLAHFVVNTVIALQGTSHSIVQPEHMAYGAVLLFTFPLGIIAFLLIRRSSSKKFQPAD
jgi:hypothetical protein